MQISPGRIFFLCFIPCTHSLIPKKSGVRSGFKVKWMDFIVAEENKTMRAYSKASWRCQKDMEVGATNRPFKLHI